MSIDLVAQVDGKPVEDAQASGLSYEVGSGTILDGLDDVLAGMSPDETATFSSELPGGQFEGTEAEVTVTVRSVKVKDLPDLDDDFAQSASEFNTVGELRSNTRKQMEAMRRLGQAGQARDRAIEELLTKIDIPLPDGLAEQEVERRHESLEHDLEQAGLTMDAYVEGRNLTKADLDKELSDDARRSLKARLILDRLAEQENLGVEQEELGQYITEVAYQQGVAPEQLAQQLSDTGQLALVVGDVLRTKAAELLAERVKVTDESGRKVAVGAQAQEQPEAGEDTEQAAEAEAEPSAKPARAKSRRSPAKAAGDEDEAPAPKTRSRSKRGKDAEAASETE